MGLIFKQLFESGFCRPENPDIDKEERDWKLWAGGNDWETNPTWIWLEVSRFDDVYRLWAQLSFPEGAVADQEGSEEEQEKATEHGQKALKVLKTAFNKTNKTTSYNSSRDTYSRWVDAFRSKEFQEFVDEWGIENRVWKDTDFSTKGNEGKPPSYYENMKTLADQLLESNYGEEGYDAEDPLHRPSRRTSGSPRYLNKDTRRKPEQREIRMVATDEGTHQGDVCWRVYENGSGRQWARRIVNGQVSTRRYSVSEAEQHTEGELVWQR